MVASGLWATQSVDRAVVAKDDLSDYLVRPFLEIDVLSRLGRDRAAAVGEQRRKIQRPRPQLGQLQCDLLGRRPDRSGIVPEQTAGERDRRRKRHEDKE